MPHLGSVTLIAITLALAHAAAPAAERVDGVQNFLYLAPQDVRLGPISFRTKRIVESTGESLTFVPNSAWGEFTLKLTKVAGKPNKMHGWRVGRESKLVACRAITLADVAGLAEHQALLLNGEVTAVEDGGHKITVVIPFKSEDVTGQIELIASKAAGPKPPPTTRNIRYGPHWQHTFDFYRAESDAPTPLLVMIHGGGWGALDKSRTWGMQAKMMSHGISLAAVNYRYCGEARRAGVKPPVQWPLHDAARAIQTMRHMAAKLNVDPQRVAAMGGSAGACTSLWLALHDDLADPESDDPVARQSTRLWCAGGAGAQTSLDPHQIREWIPTCVYGGHAFGFFDKDTTKRFQRFYDSRAQIMDWVKEYSPYELADADDPAIYMDYFPRGLEPAPNEKGWATHSPLFGIGLKKRLDELGVECYLRYKDKPSAKYDDLVDFMVQKLKEIP